MERSFNQIVDELKLRVLSVKSECDKYFYNGFDGDQVIDNIQNLIYDFDTYLNDLVEKYDNIANSSKK